MNITWQTISPAPPPQARPTEAVFQDVLSRCRRLTRILDSGAGTGEPILLIINDPHRSTQTRPALTAIAKHVESPVRARDERTDAAARIDAHSRTLRFSAIVATGMHRFSSGERREFEKDTFEGCGLRIADIAWHDATDAGSLVEIAGVRMHRLVAESRFLLPIGSVEPHYFAGLTGPHKTVTIGCMSVTDIERNHEGAMSPASEILRLNGNPVHDGITEILRRLESSGKMVCAIGEVVCGDSILAIAAGDPIEVLNELLPVVRRIYVRQIPESVDILRLRVPLPLGRNLYQADKALKNNHLAVRGGGGIILEAACYEGIGPNAFMNLLRSSTDYASAKRAVVEWGYRLGDHKAVKLRYLMDPACRGVHVAVVSPHLQPADLRGTSIEVHREIQSAIDWLRSVVTGPLAQCLVIEDAGMVTVTPAKA